MSASDLSFEEMYLCSLFMLLEYRSSQVMHGKRACLFVCDEHLTVLKEETKIEGSLQ